MDLRHELLPPPVDQQYRQQLEREISRIADLLATGQPADEAAAAFNELTGHQYAPLDFAEYDGSRDLADFALEAARPAHPRVPNVTRAELIEIVERIIAADPETDYYLRLLQANISYPGVQGLIFQPPEDMATATPAQIIDRALSYRPIAL